MKKLLIFASLIIGFFVVVSLVFAGPDHIAKYSVDRVTAIQVELTLSHPILAEYDRQLVVKRGSEELLRVNLFPDSGGYADANLYQCEGDWYRLSGYFDNVTFTIKGSGQVGGTCANPKYVGVFSGGGSKPWSFYDASQRPETELVAKGG